MLISQGAVQHGNHEDIVPTVATRGTWKETAESLVENVEVATFICKYDTHFKDLSLEKSTGKQFRKKIWIMLKF